MASISKEILIESSAEDVWEAIGDFAAGPSRMAPGFVLDTQVEADCRIVTFANGTVVRERRVSIDHNTRRIVYTVVNGDVRPEHDNASMQVIADGERRCRLVWIRDVLPDELAASMAEAMSHGLDVIKRTLDDPHAATATRLPNAPAKPETNPDPSTATPPWTCSPLPATAPPQWRKSPSTSTSVQPPCSTTSSQKSPCSPRHSNTSNKPTKNSTTTPHQGGQHSTHSSTS